MIAALTFGLVAVLGVALAWALERLFPCKCGRSRPPYFFANHERSGVMLFWALFFTLQTVGFVLTVDRVLGALFAAWAMFSWLIWWKHESEKWKRRAAKAAGRVTINAHGRLAVSHDG